MTTNSEVMTQQKSIDRVLNLLNGAKRNNNGWYSVRCPGHNDKNPSLSFLEGNDGGVILHCHAGCTREQILMGMGLSEHELRPNEQRQRTVSQSPLTIVELAFDKQLPWQLLTQEGISDDFHYKGSTGVRIPYYTIEKEEHSRFRLRLALRAKEGSFWCGTEGKLIPYGLHRLQQAREAGYLIIAEGESDAWTCWTHNIPCLGVPGATNTGCLDGSLLQGIEKLYVMQEPDSAGERFPANVQQRLEATGYKGKIYALNLHKHLGVKDLNDLHKMDIATFSDTLKPLLEQATPLFKEAAVQKAALSAIISANSLMQQDLKPPDYVVQEMLPAGLILMGGKQKIGKSWFNYRLALDVAAGKPFLDTFPTTPGDVLLLSLEDNQHRLQSRYRAIIGNDSEVPASLELAAEWPRMCSGGLEALEQWITTHANPRLIIIDPWVLVKPYVKARAGSTIYDADYEALEGVKKLADKYQLCILTIFHLRKMAADDPFDEMNASTGATACGDGFLHLSRKRGETLAKLWGTGRDYPKDINAALKFNDGNWEYKGNADDFPELSSEPGSYKPSQECQEILDLLGESKKPLMPMEIARRLGKERSTIRVLLLRMKKREEVKDTAAGYVIVGGENGCNTRNSATPPPVTLFDLPEAI
jgi:hypothetical protein